VANSRACSWNRPPIDRMANLNIEPGDQSLEQLIGGIEQRHPDGHQPLVVD
jgi:predicted Zn-dependent protease